MERMRAATGFRIPVVDISAYTTGGDAAERAVVAAQIDDAASSVGFIQIVGHQIPSAVIEEFTAVMDDFFALPLEAKKAYRTPPEINRGYAPPKSESLSLSLGLQSAAGMNDFFEAFNVGVEAGEYPDLQLPEDQYAANTWPQVDHFQAAVSAYFVEARRVAHTLTRIFADALDLPPDFFDGYTDHSLDVLRMNNYALPPGEVELEGELTGMGEHTDYGIVTVLWADQVRGLQVLDPDGRWQDVAPAEGALLINLGDLMARWTNERWMSTLHRVKPPIVDGTIERRRSAAYFHDGNIDATISTLPSCVGAGSRYSPITVGEHIGAKLAGSRAGQANPYAKREAARVQRAMRQGLGQQ
ncbi:2OG-Fe(II) oxygenase [Gordonia bronchialis DSM 43247]|uniref:2OG-Fe(II) oxygenase n=1 Tax=Gordonia bronchialis (strain ATCC 25592 / DSM 43247 / BCRC 13721 / JCM 3198 / KCTC 3076 / NBRC 16047 / NCTC 10667) TaxID=526226 RepID=D0L5M8_GORB4|nr:2-oxoglutarate and iron-dependent oxygenase domain-containing protein [Gordonia bronchialis]ACY20557.1 2OG-Fe(II) oxygenase [Gordonia bronchialis DSM 43247]MCC3323331.1 isopenicillin N synthase family oxygenase [Gordonia bronchialis]QGS25669.1 isopenicillin N synthase family oxygenase [Gordonia bronchialis]UAK37929.1 isopenicillin N synthase family oxygenase [Gordonia bronchialis]STQ63377.1 2-oxoglutarate-dependent ethylene/succinate-forming enzyme [Gordonia bronchialis]